MRTSRIVRALLRVAVVVAVLAVPAFAADTVINAVSGGSFVTVDGKRVSSVKVFFTNGVIQKRVVTESRASKVVVEADGGIKCGAEWPHIEVVIDNVPVMSAFVEGPKQTLGAPVSLEPGTHVVRVRFDNDYFEPVDAFSSSPPLPLTCDRNLLLDSLELHDDASTATASSGAPAASSPSARTGGQGRHPLDRRRGEGMGRLSRGPALARQQRVGGIQLRGPVALQPGHQPGGPGRARLPDRSP
jgi:hypothetical protein